MMKISLRKWQKEDAKALSALLNNPNILKNLRDGIPYPYTEKDALEYINIMLRLGQRHYDRSRETALPRAI